jgi:hypothetical protein
MSRAHVLARVVLLGALVGQPAAALQTTYTNATAITIVDNANASPFPSTISTPAGTWSLFIRDDSSGTAGSAAGGWSIILDVVSDVVVDVDVQLTGLSHNSFADVDALVLGPNGIGVALTTDNGGGADAVAATFVFDDEAATSILSIPTTGVIPGGTYRPEGGAGPGTAGPFGTSLAAFDGIVVPEPATALLLFAGLALVSAGRRASRR